MSLINVIHSHYAKNRELFAKAALFQKIHISTEAISDKTNKFFFKSKIIVRKIEI